MHGSVSICHFDPGRNLAAEKSIRSIPDRIADDTPDGPDLRLHIYISMYFYSPRKIVIQIYRSVLEQRPLMKR